jgi:hypothetical protein
MSNLQQVIHNQGRCYSVFTGHQALALTLPALIPCRPLCHSHCPPALLSPFLIVPRRLIFIFVPLYFLLIPFLFSPALHICYKKCHIICILWLYITYNTVVDAVRSKKARSAGVSPAFRSGNGVKLPRESLWTPWGWARLRSGAIEHPIAGNVARKHRSAAWRRRRDFCIFLHNIDGRGGVNTPSVRPTPPHSDGGV